MTGGDRQPARYVMIGGFLGAGKTTSIARLATVLSGRGLRVGLITNDQGHGLVDTTMLRSRGFATEEIAGGCFCCRFNSLMEAAQRLTDQTRPDVFIAEPVGSCTDLVATVTYPLRRIYGRQFRVSPLSVLVDPVRALRLFGLEAGTQFSAKVNYIYRKQLEEADAIVLNKCDVLEPERLKVLCGYLESEFKPDRVFEVSARTGAGLDQWFDFIAASDQEGGEAMKVDYGVYAEGEALLGWLNCTVNFSAIAAVDGNSVLERIAGQIQEKLAGCGVEVAHLKMTLSADDGLGDLAVINLVRNDYVPELGQELADELAKGELVINLRAEAAPELLERIIRNALVSVGAETPGLSLDVEHLERFRPGKPEPTHRIEFLAETSSYE